MTRVLFLTESFHPTLGGGERHIRELATRLLTSKIEPTVLTRRGDPAWPEEESLDGIRVLRVRPPGPGRTGKYLMVPHALASLRRERGRYDLIVVRGTRVLGLPGLLAARLLGKGVILQAELNGEMSGEVYVWGTRHHGRRAALAVRGAVSLRNALLRDADAFVAPSRRIYEEFLAAGVPNERVALIHHGVDIARFRPADPQERVALRRRLVLPVEDHLVVYTGRLLRGKGLEVLLSAFESLASEPAAHLVLVGSGAGQSLSIEDELRRRVAEGGLSRRVTFAGRVDNVEDYLRASDLFVFPSVFEALGLSLVEAAACGLPSVASRTGGIVDVVLDDETGFLVPPGDPLALGAALTRLVGMSEARADMGPRARARAVQLFDLEESVDRYGALFRDVAARGSRGRQ